ncbi:hypothetical protein CRI70_08710 [Streptomyces sp. Ru87]|nr:hypothetical protein CRI70_08710 [Streptomyces sp. Ru87]
MSPAAAGPLPGFRVPDELSARVPPEQRGPGSARDAIRLLVSGPGGDVSHHAFRALPGLLRAGDVLVVNTSRTLPAAVDGRVVRDRGLGEPVVVHFSTRGDDGRWAVELRVPDGSGSTGPRPGGPAGTRLRLPGGARLELEEPLDARGGRPRAFPSSRRRTPGTPSRPRRPSHR